MSSARHAALLVLAGMVLAAPAAQAYVRTTTNSGHPMKWPRRCITVVLYAGAPPPELTREVLETATRAAAATWSAGAIACTQIQLGVNVSEDSRADVAFDRRNRITFRRGLWQKEPCDPAQELCGPYEPAALAITSVFSKTDGTILDVDMELNAVHFRWADVALQGRRNHQDVQNALTHEFGHLLGLDHNCYLPGPDFLSGADRGVPRDHTGQEVPDCSTASALLQEATMFASAIPGDTQKRQLALDDIQAVCDIYPASGGLACGEEDDGGCAVAGPPMSSSAQGARPGAFFGATAVTLLAALTWRRRRTGFGRPT
jgi:hypothetical protein